MSWSYEDCIKREKEERDRLAKIYTPGKTKSISHKQLIKIAYIMGLGHISGKRKCMDEIIKYQNYENPFIVMNKGNYEFNNHVNMWEYVNKG